MKISISRSTLSRLALIALLLGAAFAMPGSDGIRQGSVSAQTTVTVVNAASFAADKVLTPDSIGAAFGQFVTQNNQVFSATTVPLPTTLGGVRVRVGAADAGIFFVAPSQINFQIPVGLADTTNAQITVTNSDNTARTGTFTIVRGAPGVFSAKATGQGVAAALTTFDGAVFQSVFNPDGTEKDVDAGTRQRPNVLILYTTGIRNTPATAPNDANGVAESISVKFQGVPGQLLFAGPAPGFVALDQINVIIPPELAGLGSIRVVVSTIAGTNSYSGNAVTIRLGGTTPPVRVTQISFGQTVTGDLAVDDQVQQGMEGKTYFFDAYRFTTTAANTTIAADLRSMQFDAGVLLYRVDNNTLTLLGADDQTGGYGNGRTENNNALLLVVIPNPGDYVIFASSSDFEPNGIGQYSLKLTNNVATQISYGQSAASPSIATGDLQTAAGTYLDAYWFNGVSNDNVRINMGSSTFDSFLILQSNDGDPPVANDDNSGGGPAGRDAQITFRLPATGIYIILATPYEPNRTGAYTLALTRLASFGSELEDAFNYRAPGREIIDYRGPATGIGGSTFERFGRRRVIR
jgi:uncharacterized protein (TIGR03437 family)